MNTTHSLYETDAETAEAVIDLLALEGFSPVDDEDYGFPEWIQQRYDAARPDDDGYTCAKWSDDGIRLYSMTDNGVGTAKATFSFNALGVKMLAGTLEAIR
jgi:hypothetical protein